MMVGSVSLREAAAVSNLSRLFPYRAFKLTPYIKYEFSLTPITHAILLRVELFSDNEDKCKGLNRHASEML